jgi:hypothetical protein
MAWAMIGLFHPLEKDAALSGLTVGALCFVDSLGCILQFSLEFVECDISTFVWVLESYYLD